MAEIEIPPDILPPDDVALRKMLTSPRACVDRMTKYASVAASETWHAMQKSKMARFVSKDEVGKKLGGSRLKSRFYWVNPNFNRNEILNYVRARYASLSISLFNRYIKEGVRFIVLHLGFDTEHGLFESDFRDSNIVSVTGKELSTVPDTGLDSQGNFIPVPDRKVVVNNLPLHVSESEEKIREIFGEYFEFYETLDTKYFINKEGCMNGSILFKIKDYKKIPAKEFKASLNGNEFEVSVRCINFSRTKPDLVRETNDVTCFTCKKVGHLARDCEVRKNMVFKWKCTVCKKDSLGCKINACKSIMPHVKDSKNYEHPQQNNAWTNFDLRGTKLVETPTIDQCLHSMKYSTTINSYFVKLCNKETGFDYENLRQLIMKWTNYRAFQIYHKHVNS